MENRNIKVQFPYKLGPSLDGLDVTDFIGKPFTDDDGQVVGTITGYEDGIMKGEVCYEYFEKVLSNTLSFSLCSIEMEEQI